MFIKPSSTARTTSLIVRPLLSVLLLIAFVMAGASAAAAGPRAFVLINNSLVTIDIANPTQVSPPLAITGLNAGDTLVGIDFRPQNGFLYGLGYNSVADTVMLYAISHRTGVATAVGDTGSFVDAGGNPAPITGTSFGFDINPAVDRVRVVTNTGQNFRINVNNGAFVDGDLGGGVTAGLNMDGPIAGGTTTVDSAAYTNNQPNNGNITTLYTLDAVTNSRYIQNPPNVGTQTLAVAVTLNGNPLDFTSANGFDILPGVNAPASNNAVATGSGFAVLTVGGTTSLYSINLVNGAAALVGPIGNGLSAVQGLALQGEPVPGGLPAIGNTANSLVRFNTVTPGTLTTQATSGIVPGESLVAVDWRPQTGQLFALGFDAANGTGSATLYRVDPQTGVLTIIGVGGGVANGAGAPISLAGAASFGFDFNPTVDRIRVVTNNGINFRINPNTGTVVGTGDGLINGLPAGSTGVTGAAYTNSFGQALVGGVTTLYTLDANSNSLFIQNPPNNGTQTLGLGVTLSGVPVDFTTASGFDIPGDISVSTSNTAAVGRAYAQLVVGGVTGLYTIELSTGAATSIGAIGAGTPGVTGLALGEGAKIATTTALTSSANPSVAGQAVTFTAAITPAGVTGAVAFTANGTPITGCNARPVAAGAATCTTTFAAVGGVSIVASYGGSDTHNGSTSAPLAQIVNAIPTTTTLLGPAGPVKVGAPALVIASLAPTTATGTVTFRVDGAVAAIIFLNSNVARFIVDSLPVGTHEVIATYNGDTAHAVSNSAPVTLTIATEVSAPFTQYFAEGATGFFQTDIGIVNASRTNAANVDVTLFPETGVPLVLSFILDPLTRRSLDLNGILGPGQGVSTLVESDQPVGATRQMTWGTPVYGSTLESGIPEKATTWYFAEGATNVFSLFFLIENPSATEAVLTFTHLLEGGAAPVVRNIAVPAASRRTFNINEVPELATAALSTVITSTVPVVAERAMYLNTTTQPLVAGTAGRGATALSTTWSLAEGATGFFHTYLLLGNPNAGEAIATVRYQLPDGTAFDKQYPVPGQSRRTVDVNFEDARLASTAVGMSITSTLPIVSERAMWWGDPFIEGSVAIGSTATGTAWAIGEGGEGGTLTESTFVLVANASPNTGTIRFTVVYDDGTNEQKEYGLLGNARLTVRIGDDFAKARESTFSVLVESVTAGVPIAVEVARYQSAGTVLGAGGAAPATRIQ